MFDYIFQGPPSGVAAPGTVSSAALGVDAANNNLYVSAGKGWQIVGSGSAITALTGDVTASGTGSVAATLATVNSNVGTFLNAKVTANGKGLVTAVAAGTSGADSLAQTGNNANVLTKAITAAGLYEVELYEVSANAPTSATLPAITVTYTDAETSGSITLTLADVTAVSAANVTHQGSFTVNAAASSNIVVATTSYAAGSGTALSYNVKARVTTLG